MSEALVTRKLRIPEHSAQITNTKAASFPSDPQLPLNPFENMDKVRVTILLAVFTPRHRCAGSFQPSGKHIHFLQWHTHLDLKLNSAVSCSRPWGHRAATRGSLAHSSPPFITPINHLPTTLDVG